MVLCSLADIHNRSFGLTCWNLTDAYCFHDITSITIPLALHCMLTTNLCKRCVSLFNKYKHVRFLIKKSPHQGNVSM